MLLSKKSLLFDLKNISPWDDVNNETNPIQKFLMYKSRNKESVIYDCDNSNGTSKIANAFYFSLWGWNYDNRLSIPDSIKHKVDVEWDRYGSDTMNSFMTTYKAAVKIYGSEVLAQKNKLLIEFASLTHCLSNFTMMPFKLQKDDDKSFNQYRGANFGKYFVYDYFDLSLQLIKESISFNAFKQYIDTFILNDYVDDHYNVKPLMSKQSAYLKAVCLDLSNPSKFLPNTEEELNEYLRNVISIIKSRSIRLMHEYNKRVSENGVLSDFEDQIVGKEEPVVSNPMISNLKSKAKHATGKLSIFILKMLKSLMKRILRILIKFTVLAAVIYMAIPTLIKSNNFRRMIDSNYNGVYSLYEVIIFTIAVYMVIALIMFYVRFRYGEKLKVCPRCKFFFAVKEISRETIATRNVSVMVKSHDRNRNGEITSTREQYVPGIEEKQRVKESCRFCKNEFVYEVTNKKPIL